MTDDQFDALTQENGVFWIEMNRQRAAHKQQLESISCAEREHFARLGFRPGLPELNDESAAALHRMRRELQHRQADAERAMLAVCEVMYEGPLKLLVFIPAWMRTQIQRPRQVVADTARESAAILRYTAARLDEVAFEFAVRRGHEEGWTAYETRKTTLVLLYDCVTFHPLISYNLNLLFGFREIGLAQVVGAKSAETKLFARHRSSLERDRVEAGDSRLDRLHRRLLAAVADLPTTKQYPDLHPAELRFGDYTVLTPESVPVLDIGFIPFTDLAEKAWRGFIRGFEKEVNAEDAQVQRTGPPPLMEQGQVLFGPVENFEEAFCNRDEIEALIRAAALSANEEEVIRVIIAFMQDDPDILTSNARLSALLNRPANQIAQEKMRGFAKLRETASRLAF